MVTLNFPPGRQCSAATPSLMAALSPRQIVWAMKRQPGAMASSFGDKVLSARPVAKFWRKDPSIAKKSFRPKWNGNELISIAHTGHFCAIEEWTPTREFSNG